MSGLPIYKDLVIKFLTAFFLFLDNGELDDRYSELKNDSISKQSLDFGSSARRLVKIYIYYKFIILPKIMF